MDETPIKFPYLDWQCFLNTNGYWFAATQAEGRLVYCLHPRHLDACLRLFELDAAAEIAERKFVTLCDQHDAIGVSNGQFIRYPLLRPLLAWPGNFDLSPFLKLGWTPSDIACMRNLTDPTLKINRRLRAAAGRLVSSPKFLEAASNIRNHWEKLPIQIRPFVPIARSFKSPSAGELDLKPAPQPLADFTAAFDRFCDEWHLLGIATWDLPNVRGPQWVPELAPKDLRERGVLSVETPWHFPVLGEDGLGPLLQDEHRRQAAEHGAEDEQSWETYESMLDIYFWQHVLRGRYPRQQLVRPFVTAMVAVLSDILGLSVERVQRLRKWLGALQSGTVTTLRGRRNITRLSDRQYWGASYLTMRPIFISQTVSCWSHLSRVVVRQTTTHKEAMWLPKSPRRTPGAI